MKRVKVSDAKANLSRHLEYVRRGGRIRIVHRNAPIADLVPIELDERDDWGHDELERKGLLRRGKGGPLPAGLMRPGPRPRRSASGVAALLEERRRDR
jgi:prevent-host-death family protein